MLEPLDVKLDRIHRRAFEADSAIEFLQRQEPESVTEVLTAAHRATQRIANLFDKDFSQNGLNGGLTENER